MRESRFLLNLLKTPPGGINKVSFRLRAAGVGLVGMYPVFHLYEQVSNCSLLASEMIEI